MTHQDVPDEPIDMEAIEAELRSKSNAELRLEFDVINWALRCEFPNAFLDEEEEGHHSLEIELTESQFEAASLRAAQEGITVEELLHRVARSLKEPDEAVRIRAAEPGITDEELIRRLRLASGSLEMPDEAEGGAK